MADQAHIKRERAKARELRESQWWKNQIGPGVCHHCGQKFPKSQLTMDHLTPLARGGKTTKSNVVPSCKACNQTRGHKLDVERALDEMSMSVDGIDGIFQNSANDLWISPEHLAVIGQASPGVNCFAVSRYYFGGSVETAMKADDVLDWVASQFMQIETPAAYDEPVLVLVWSRKTGDGRPPNIVELAKRSPGFPFDWVLEHSTVLVGAVGERDQSVEAAELAELAAIPVFDKASPRDEDVIQIRPFGQALESYIVKPGFALSFHLPV